MDKHNTILQLYKEGVPKYKIASRVHCSKSTIEREIEAAIRNHEIEGYLKARRSDCNKGGRPKNVLPAEVRYATVCDLYKKGYIITEICEATGMCYETVQRELDRGREEGNLWPKNAKERLEAMRRHRAEKGIKDEERKKERVYHYAPPTLQPGETVKCTCSVSDKCVYGRRNNVEALCRYSLVTGKCRTVGPNREFINPRKACACFSKVSNSNPKLANAEVE